MYKIFSGNLWHLAIGTLNEWKMWRCPPYSVPYYGIYKQPYMWNWNSDEYIGYGIYVFPFVFRRFKKIREGGEFIKFA